MRLTVNGENMEYEGASSLDALLERLNIKKDGSAVELNGKILGKEEWVAQLNDGDKIEIITFVGGG